MAAHMKRGKGKMKNNLGAPSAKRVRIERTKDTLVEEVSGQQNVGPQNIRSEPSEADLDCIDLDGGIDMVESGSREENNKIKNQAEEESLRSLFECHSIGVYQKYNRLDKLVSDVVNAVKDSIEKKTEGDLPSEISADWCSSFQHHMVTLPSAQVQIIFNGLLNILDIDCITPLEKDPEDVKCLKILSITSQLLRIFLGGVHIADHTVHAHRVVQFLKMMGKLHVLLGRLGSALLQKQYDHSLMASFLALCLAWGDLHILLLYYRPIEEMTERPKLADADTTPTNLFGLHSYMVNDQWSLIAQRITNFGESTSKRLLDKLILQKLSVMVIVDDGICKDASAAAARSLSMSLEEDLLPTLGRNGLMLTGSLDNKQILALAARIVHRIKTVKKWPENELQMPGIQENRPLILGLLVQTLSGIGEIFGSSKCGEASSLPGLVKDVVAYFTSATIQDTDMISHETDEFFSKIVTNMCHCLEKNLEKDVAVISTEKTKVNYYTLDRSLRILTALPLENLDENIQTIILSCCLALVISMETACPDDEKWNDMPTEQKVQNLILRLLDGRRAPNISKHMKVGLFLRWLSQAKIERNEAHCRKLLELLFGTSLADIRFLESLEVGVPLLLRDGDKKAETNHPVHFETAIILLQTINKCKISNKKLEFRCRQMQKRLGNRLMRFSSRVNASEFERDDLLFGAFSASLKSFLSTKDTDLLNDIAAGIRDVVVKMFTKVKEKDAHSLALLSLLLENEMVLKKILPEDFMLTAWEAAVDVENISEQHVKLIEAMDWEQFKKAINALLDEMETSCSEAITPEQVEKYSKLWTSVVTARHNNYKFLFLLKSLPKLTNILLTALLMGRITNIKPILEFNLAAVNQRDERTSKVLLDFYLESITVLSLPDMNSVQLGLKLLTDIFYKCSALVTQALPAVLQRYTHIMGLIAHAASTDCQDPLLETCAFGVERLASLIAKHNGFTSWGPYNIIADILQQFEMHALRPDIKIHFMNAMHCFFENCDSNIILFLGKTLTPASKTLFEAEYRSYITHHRYVGKI